MITETSSLSYDQACSSKWNPPFGNTIFYQVKYYCFLRIFLFFYVYNTMEIYSLKDLDTSEITY